jgi:hypothetical protein
MTMLRMKAITRIPILRLTLGMSLSLLFQLNLQAQTEPSAHRNALKLDLIGIPMAFLYIQNASYPRLSLEFERTIKPDSKWSWVVDAEAAKWNEEYLEPYNGHSIEWGNSQANFSLISGIRYYFLQFSKTNHSSGFFVEPRLSGTFSKANLQPFTFLAIPSRTTSATYLLPRLRGGAFVALTNRIAAEASIDLLIQKGLGSRRRSFSSIAELNFAFSF